MLGKKESLLWMSWPILCSEGLPLGFKYYDPRIFLLKNEPLEFLASTLISVTPI